MMGRFAFLVLVALSGTSLFAAALPVNLGTADTFSVLAGTTVTNTGATTINGDLGVWSGSAITGFPPGVVTNGVVHAADSFAMQAQNDLTTAYTFAAGEACGTTLSGNLGGLTLTPGVYCFASSAQLTGTLTLDALGNKDAVFLFQIGTTLTTDSSSIVTITNPGTGDSVYWQVGSSATLGTNSKFAGNILALTSITANTGASINCGRALARNGAVTLDTNNVSIDTLGCEAFAPTTGVPEPASMALGGIGLTGLLVLARRRRTV